MSIQILTLSEDGSPHAHATIKALAKKLLQLVDDQCKTNLVDFKPADKNLALISRAAQWKNPERHNDLVKLRRTIATRIAMGPGNFVLFHVDGDRRWSERSASENHALFKSEIADRVRARLKSAKTDWSEEQIERCMSRLILLMPFYSIEAWTYQNTRYAKQLCRERYGGRDVKRFDEWERDRASLDEVEKPKAKTCLGSKHNQELAENAFPHREARDADTSLAEAVKTLSACEDLVAALRQTWQTWEAH